MSDGRRRRRRLRCVTHAAVTLGNVIRSTRSARESPATATGHSREGKEGEERGRSKGGAKEEGAQHILLKDDPPLPPLPSSSSDGGGGAI